MIAFIVDGELEKIAVERLCEQRAVIRTPRLNGKNVTAEALAARIFTLVKLLRNRCHPIVIIVDREQRILSSIEFENALENRLVELGCQKSQLIIACADTMIENWIVAGSITYKDQDLACCREDGVDGSNGKSVLRQSLREIGQVYGETTVGVELLVTMVAQRAAKKSSSFARFLPKLAPYCPRWAGANQ